jgi:hypothetical protein
MAKHPKFAEFSKTYGTAPVWIGPEEAKSFVPASEQAHKKLFDLLQGRGK